MLNDKQVESAIECIETGQGTEFHFEDAPLCEVIDAIIEHLESQRMEKSLFGLVAVSETPEPEDFKQLTPEQAQRAFTHHAMHWAFQLGVGAALKAVGVDQKSSTDGEGQV